MKLKEKERKQSRLISTYNPYFRLKGWGGDEQRKKFYMLPYHKFPEYELQTITFVLGCLANPRILRSAFFWNLEWQVVTDVSVPLTGPIFNGQAVLEDGTHTLFRNVGNKLAFYAA
jgi:hypothetical protein